MKLIYPDENATKEEMQELLEYALEQRRRVKEQLKKMSPSEFNDVELGYIDIETDVEKIIEVPEQPKTTLIFDGIELPGYVYAIGRSERDLTGVYRLENKLVSGTGKFDSKNIEGAGSSKNVKDSITAAFNYFGENAKKFLKGSLDSFDYTLYLNDLQAKGVSDELSVAEVVGLCSALANKPVLNSLAIVGKVVMSGSMMPVTISLTDIITAAINAGAKKILLPEETKEKFESGIKSEMKSKITPIYYSTPLDAAKKALGVEE